MQNVISRMIQYASNHFRSGFSIFIRKFHKRMFGTESARGESASARGSRSNAQAEKGRCEGASQGRCERGRDGARTGFVWAAGAARFAGCRLWVKKKCVACRAGRTLAQRKAASTAGARRWLASRTGKVHRE
ncbi:uncharacterized protein LOC130936837 [Arachis stenosperma]|uniref:uncharacterized protein LOC130936837 n=1 Tax=Arachis stenosperma TaxID=217475 RepID=UPI0025ACC077|nr:uncharacterized protein LOC130936837 [Arachis stenosperma]